MHLLSERSFDLQLGDQKEEMIIVSYWAWLSTSSIIYSSDLSVMFSYYKGFFLSIYLICKNIASISIHDNFQENQWNIFIDSCKCLMIVLVWHVMGISTYGRSLCMHHLLVVESKTFVWRYCVVSQSSVWEGRTLKVGPDQDNSKSPPTRQLHPKERKTVDHVYATPATGWGLGSLHTLAS